jgi:hypothetical protein
MANLNGFDANTVEPRTEFDAIPAGDYTAILKESEMKATKDGAGKYLQLTWEIVDGQYKGRKFWDRLNLQNKSAQAVAIAEATLSSICRAIGVMKPADSQQLHGVPVTISVKCVKRDDSGEITNEIKGYSKLGAKNPAAGSAQAASTDSVAPWARSAN